MVPNIDNLDVIIRHKNAKYSAFIPQIGVTGTGESLQAALDDLEQKKKAYIDDLAEAGLVADVVPIAEVPIPESPIFPAQKKPAAPVSDVPVSPAPVAETPAPVPLVSAPPIAPIVVPASIGRPSLGRELAGFGLKTLIFVAILGGAIAWGASIAAERANVFAIDAAEKANELINNARVSIKEVSEPFQSVGGRKFWGKVEDNLAELSERDLPEAQKQKLLLQFRSIAEKWRPFVVEAQHLFAVDQPATPNQSKK
jgi:predicted RNase H-like HicB family nuclease